MEFDWDGSYLATGDKGGRVVLFEKVPMQQVRHARVCRACVDATGAAAALGGGGGGGGGVPYLECAALITASAAGLCSRVGPAAVDCLPAPAPS